MSNSSGSQDGLVGGETPPVSPRPARFLAQIATVRELLAAGRELFPPHWDVSPRWDLHESRLYEIERHLSLGIPEDCEPIATLRAEFLRHLNAEMASSMAEPLKRLARLLDQVADRQPENKFHIPLDAFDCGEDFDFPVGNEP